MNVGNHWSDLTAQQLVRYDALFELLGVLQLDDELDRIADEVARRFKYFANVASWRLLVENGTHSVHSQPSMSRDLVVGISSCSLHRAR